MYIRNLEEHQILSLANYYHETVLNYQKDLTAVFLFTAETLKNITDEQLEDYGNSKKIITSWGQTYTIEQILEHAIVHILRHRRQIEKFKLVLGLTE